MKKNYFEELTTLVDSIKNPSPSLEYVAKDCLYRALCWKESHEEYDANWMSDDYVKRQLDFLQKFINK